MTFEGVRTIGSRLLSRIRQLPLPALILLAAIPIAFLLALAVSGSSGPGYDALYEGLRPSQGGAVIATLQKDGIPYRLSENGNVISVPASDIGKARLEMGAAGQPNRTSSADWRALEHASMTTSHAAVRALRLQARQSSLERTIRIMSGARQVRVMIAMPRSTPFLADQPKPKASVVLTDAAQPDSALGAAVASIVAHGVPGLARKDVVVATGHGHVLFPTTRRDSTDQQLAIQARIEATQESKIRSLLVPVLGAGNFRIAVSAAVSFARKKIDNVSYGPKSYPVSQDISKHHRIGVGKLQMGIPGALSNQPPGPTTAPVKAAAGSGKKSGNKATARSRTTLPQSRSSHESQHFAIDETRTQTRPAGWHVRAIDVAVVVNRNVLKGITTTRIRKMIASANAVSGSSVSVTSASFVRPGQRPVARSRPRLSRIIQAVLIVLAALALLFGLILPLVRWLRRGEPVVERPDVEKDPGMAGRRPATDPFREAQSHVSAISHNEPAAVARVLQKWALSGRTLG